MPPSQVRALMAICCGDPLNPFSSLSVRTRPRIPDRAAIGVEAAGLVVLVVVLLVVREAVLWLALQPASPTHAARQKRAGCGRIRGP